jgi:hypothetical protein
LPQKLSCYVTFYKATNGEDDKFVEVLVRKSERRRKLGRPTHRWKDNIKTDLQKEAWGHGID